jgi:NAD(P)-dependent dehydrogenase (short-subunit alcohol dehydrogenase family)
VAVQYGPRGIRSNAVAPGLVLTPAVEGMTPQQVEASRRNYPMPARASLKTSPTPVLYLASGDAGYVNGAASIYLPSTRGEPSRAD